jgi:hypothetical protein
MKIVQLLAMWFFQIRYKTRKLFEKIYYAYENLVIYTKHTMLYKNK